MKTTSRVLPLLALLAPALAAQVDPALAASIRAEGILNSKVMQYLDYLTNHIGHRLTGSENLVKAAYWVGSEFERMGLSVEIEKWGEWKVGWNRGQWSGRVVSPEPMDLQIATDAWTAGTPGAVTGPLVVAPTTENEIAERAKDLRGAWVFDPTSVPDYEAGGGEGRGRGRGGPGGVAGMLRERAAELGIVGFVRSSVGTAQYPNRIRVFGDSNVARMDWDSLPTTPEVVVRYDQAKKLKEMLAAGQKVEVEIEVRNRFTPGPVPLYNVIAELRGSELPDEYVYVCGHLDSWHQATGTTDNGTGTTSTMEAARILTAVGAKPRRTIRFAVWGGEEQGLLGSAGHVKMRRTQMDNVSAVFNHDTGTNWAASLGVTAVMKDDMEKVFAPVMELSPPDADHEGPVFSLRVVQGLSGGGSDHASFLAANVPGLTWGLTGRSDYFGYTWHSQYDTYNVAIPEYQAHNATVFALAALGTANLPEKLNREGLRPVGGNRGSDATAMLSGFFGAEFDGLKVKTLEKEGLMAKSGIEAGDVLKAVNGKPVTALVDIFRIGREDGLDKGVELTMDRGGKELKVKMSMENAPTGRRGRRRGGD